MEFAAAQLKEFDEKRLKPTASRGLPRGSSPVFSAILRCPVPSDALPRAVPDVVRVATRTDREPVFLLVGRFSYLH